MVDKFNDSDGDDSVGKILFVSSNHGQNSWIRDIGATYNMCPHRRWVFTYKQMSCKVFLGNHYALPVKGIGNIRLRMFDGIVRTLDCWHVPGLKRNLLSVTPSL